MEAVKIRVRLGSVEFDYEGSESFLMENVQSLLTGISKVAAVAPIQVSRDSQSTPPVGESSDGALFDFSTNTIASVTGAKTGPDLAMAAAAHLTLAKGHDKFARKELLAEMQSATTFYNQSYSGNLTKILNGLTRGKRLNLVSNNTYALTRNEREAFSAKLSAES